jgi:hypothetical protein
MKETENMSSCSGPNGDDLHRRVPTGIAVCAGLQRACEAYARKLPQLALDAKLGERAALQAHSNELWAQISARHRTVNA